MKRAFPRPKERARELRRVLKRVPDEAELFSYGKDMGLLPDELQRVRLELQKMK